MTFCELNAAKKKGLPFFVIEGCFDGRKEGA